MEDPTSITAIMKSLNIEQSRSPPKLNIKTISSELHAALEAEYSQAFDPLADDIPDYDKYD